MTNIGEIVYGSYYFECDAEDYAEIRAHIIEWAMKGRYELGLQQDDNAETFFEKLGMGDGVSMDDEEGLTLEGNLDCSKVCYPYIKLLQVLAPYIFNEDIGQIVTEEKGVLDIKNKAHRIKVVSGDLD